MRIILKFLMFVFLQFASFAAFMSANSENGILATLIGSALGLLSFWILFKPKKVRNRV